MLKTIAWIATFVSIVGIVFNAYKMIWCWPILIFSNFLWVFYSVKTKQSSQIVLWIFLIFVNIYAWYQWAKEAVLDKLI
jgi:nicotinamide riboside transporter PnuC